MRFGLILGVLVAVAGFLLPASADARYSSRKAIWGPVAINGRSAFPLYEQLGVGIYEMSLPWSTVAPARPASAADPRDPAYRWPAEVTTAIREAKRHRIRVLLQIITTPRWANGGRAPNWTPEKATDFAAFAAAAARRYPGVHLWMVWGEPSRTPNFQPLEPAKPGQVLTASQAAAPRRYARMLDAAYAALKHESRRNLVIGGNTYTGGDILTAQWVENMRLPNGRPPRMDLYGHNPFSLREPDLSKPPSPIEGFVDFSDLARLERLVARHLARPRGKHRLRLFLSEWTIPTAPDSEFNYHVDLPVQRRWITSAFRIVNRSPWIYALGWIHLYDDPPGGGGSAGGLLFADGRKKPGFYAFQRG